MQELLELVQLFADLCFLQQSDFDCVYLWFLSQILKFHQLYIFICKHDSPWFLK